MKTLIETNSKERAKEVIENLKANGVKSARIGTAKWGKTKVSTVEVSPREYELAYKTHCPQMYEILKATGHKF